MNNPIKLKGITKFNIYCVISISTFEYFCFGYMTF